MLIDPVLAHLSPSILRVPVPMSSTDYHAGLYRKELGAYRRLEEARTEVVSGWVDKEKEGFLRNRDGLCWWDKTVCWQIHYGNHEVIQ